MYIIIMLITINNLNKFFEQEFKILNCKETTKAYIISILSKYKCANFDYSDQSLTIIYGQAKLNGNFSTFQNIADWIFFCEVIFPTYLQNASKEYYHSIAQLSYYNCYKLINRQIDVYEQLSDEFTTLIKLTKNIIQNI